MLGEMVANVGDRENASAQVASIAGMNLQVRWDMGIPRVERARER